MNTKLLFTLICVAISFLSLAQKKEMQTITESDLKAHLEFIASDNLQGRDFFTEAPGLNITADYLKAQCAKMGLKPGVEGYFQKFELEAVTPDPDQTVMRLKDGSGNVSYETKNIFSLGGPAKNDTVIGDVVFAGFGWYNEDTKYNDTKDLDLKDKIVLVMTRTLEQSKEGAEPEMETEMKKMSRAMMGGAKAIVLVSDPMNPNPEYIESIRKYATGGSLTLKGAKSSLIIPIRLIFGTEELADKMLEASGKTLAGLQKEILESESPKSFSVNDLTAEVKLIKSNETVEGKNVVAVIEGSDPVLKNECIVFTSHYDHLGIDGEGGIYNGADDNGTGTVAMLEIAEAFQSMKRKPKRSIVFAWVTGEEKGLLGSDYYSQNPIFPMENTLADINLDMVGRSAEKELEVIDSESKSLAGPNGMYIVSGKQSTELMKISDEVCEDLGLVPSDELTKAFLTRSDYYHFYKNGVPILGLSTGLHEDYHKITDEIEKIDFHKMKRVTQYAFSVAYKVANQNKRLVVDKPVQ
ncbi:M20/M25/M40 family metallo-hydrolase [Draconibacterium sp. IB214405]|uniref:M20/M25/M40 family metallo-hydrolase n=1 Tax=Draconibacterium sp. IB214405 TaxID=3097352 RepID=UPI002A122CF9|nr:M20/M25/M40 family metallo-hydrolase [Draconibacterium sp. IB214405]MDX8338456.1 M20/M25/M40 family metallo-hydrolase [Draconibacterium sp. IB214405]